MLFCVLFATKKLWEMLEKAFIFDRSCSIIVSESTGIRKWGKGCVTTLWDTIQNMVWNVLHRPGLSDVVDIFIVAAIIYKLLMMTRQTRGSAVLKGLVLLLIIVGISDALGLTALNWLLMTVISNGAVVLVILFQPELRKALETMGRGTTIDTKKRRDDSAAQERIVTEIIQCLTNLSRRRVGALIVFERKTGLQDVIETGITIDAQISAALLENIFEPNTPLHDGAVVVRGSRVQAGGCILTLTEGRGIGHELGTRHRAAIGASENTDAVVLIVSEETGIISMAKGGKLTRHLDTKSLREILSGIYEQSSHSRLLENLLNRVRKEEAK